MNFDSVYNGLLRAESRSLQKAFLLFTKNGRVVGAPAIQLFGLVFLAQSHFTPHFLLAGKNHNSQKSGSGKSGKPFIHCFVLARKSCGQQKVDSDQMKFLDLLKFLSSLQEQSYLKCFIVI